jgi:hypothetical protein
MAWKFDHCLPPKQDNIVNERDELKECVKSFFEDYLNIREESDSGRMFAPIHVSCCRAMHCVALADLLERMRSLSGASLPRRYEE